MTQNKPEMTNTIKQIEEDQKLLSDFVSDRKQFGGATIDEAIERSLMRDRVLQKMANGEDWQPIETAPENTKIKTTTESKKVEWQGVIKTVRNAPRCFVIKEQGDYVTFANPTHWKHLDPAKHLAMMMEKEVEDGR